MRNTISGRTSVPAATFYFGGKTTDVDAPARTDELTTVQHPVLVGRSVPQLTFVSAAHND